jgi:hypothetical protein
MRMNPFAFLSAVVSLAAIAALGACSSTRGSVPFRRVMQGPVAPFAEPTNFVARSAEEWKAHWGALRTTIGGSDASPGGDPGIDWTREMVVCVAVGNRPSGGYSVDIESMNKSGDELVIRAFETQPAPNTIQTRMVTSPYATAVTERFDGKVRFDVTSGPPPAR